MLSLAASMAAADEVIVSTGRGAQPGAEQSNRATGIDFVFYTFERSVRQHLEVGVAYTRLSTNAGMDESLYAVSVFPQLTFYPAMTSRIAVSAPPWAQPYFFVRALGPSYISAGRLGDREQADHFSFIAQVGAGVLLDANDAMKVDLSVSWKHFSNANLFRENDGIDVPFVFSAGVRF